MSEFRFDVNFCVTLKYIDRVMGALGSLQHRYVAVGKQGSGNVAGVGWNTRYVPAGVWRDAGSRLGAAGECTGLWGPHQRCDVN